ncbi:MAG TPA: periplasmic heavy metal sensor [Thermoanaerobaculia bacterium]|jgi:hypothetical protein|nr:periplasmic heavy metal sensor [Thermoanaerobaculia bacterium]
MRRVLFAAALLACAAIAQGQGLPPGKWWQRPAVIQELQLTNEQQDRLDEIFRGAANDLIDARGAIEKLQIAIRGELDRSQVRKPELLRLANQLSDARGKLFERELVMLIDMRAVLNEQQWTRMRRILDRMQGNRQERGQGAPPQRRRPNSQ